jgi:hypothetical protein
LSDNLLISHIEQALTGLARLIKARRFYPQGHPSLQLVVQETMQAFMPLLKSAQPPVIHVKQDGFFFEQQKVGEKSATLPDLALMMAERRVNQLLFLTDLPQHELLALIDGLNTPADAIYQRGGLPNVLSEQQVGSIWLNENSLDSALKKRQKMTAATDEKNTHSSAQIQAEKLIVETEKTALTQQLQEIIVELETDLNDEKYQRLLEKLLTLAPAYFEQSKVAGMLRILPLLLTQSEQEHRSPAQRQMAGKTLGLLLTEANIHAILGQFRQTMLTPGQFSRLQSFVVALKLRIAPAMLNQLSREEDGKVRKRLTFLLSKMGEPLIALLRDHTDSPQWYVVRNSVILLGELRLDSGIGILEKQCNHPDQRVRRAVIRSLAMIGGQQTLAPLMRMTYDPEPVLCRLAVKALGATRSAAAVKPLLVIARQFDPFGRKVELRKDAVAALGTLGEASALKPLIKLGKRMNLLGLRRLEELRAEIILTLGKLGDPSIIDDLRRWEKSSHGSVQRAAEQSLILVAKKHDKHSAN